MNRLTGEELKEFLKEFGYNWEGLMSRPAKYPFSQAHEVYSVDLEDLISVDGEYILVNTTAIAGDIVRVPNSSVIRLIRTSPICFQIYRPTSTSQKWELDKDLSDEWVNEQILKDPECAEDLLKKCDAQIHNQEDERVADYYKRMTKFIKELLVEIELSSKTEGKERIRCLDFINNEKFSEFMTSNGYNLVGYDHNRYYFNDCYIRFGFFGGHDNAYLRANRGLILVGPQSQWDESMKGFNVKAIDVVGNPFVKYLVWDLTGFKIYSIENNPGAKGFGSDEPLYMAKLEKDLSKEWIEFWALEEEDYVKYVLEECEQVQKETPKSIERHKNLLAKRIVELQKETAGYIAGDNEKLEKYNAIEQIVTQAKLEKEVGACVQYGAKQGWKDNDTKDIVGLGSIFGSEK